MRQSAKRHTTKRRARKVLEKPVVVGWRTSDVDELELRRWRGRTEIAGIEAIEPEHGPFGTFRVRSTSGSVYEVEIRDLTARNNSCGCTDHRVNGLGACKHIEGVLAALRSKRGFAASSASSPRVEVFLRRAGAPEPAILWPKAGPDATARAFLAPFLGPEGALRPEPANIKALLEAAPSAPGSIRISRHFGAWLDRATRLAAREESRVQFLAAVAEGRASWDVVKQPLLAYQKEGAAHLAFHERALLCDEMGLGKTIQAIAACELLARRESVERVLVVSPTSVKAEWEDQIARFTDRGARFVAGLRPSGYGSTPNRPSSRSSTTSRW